MYQTDEKKENTLFHFFSIRIRASTAITYFSVASSGLISISLISVAKRNKVERRTIISANLSSFTPFCPRVPLIIFVSTKGMNHGVSLFIRKRCQTGRNVLKHFHKNTTQTTQLHARISLHTWRLRKFRTRQHRLYQDTCHFGNLPSYVQIQTPDALLLDVKHHTAYVGFMNRSHYLCHYRGNPCDEQKPAPRLYWPTQIPQLWECRQHAAMPVHNGAEYIHLRG